MVRVVKHWRDCSEWLEGCKPKSYLLEIIMLFIFSKVHLCRNSTTCWLYASDYPPVWKAAVMLRLFFETIASINPRSRFDQHHVPFLFICFQRYYKKEDLQLSSPEPLLVRKVRKKRRKVIHATAIVMDPTNPTNNLWLTLADSGRSLISKARQTLKKMGRNDC